MTITFRNSSLQYVKMRYDTIKKVPVVISGGDGIKHFKAMGHVGLPDFNPLLGTILKIKTFRKSFK